MAKGSHGVQLWMCASGGALVKVAGLLTLGPPKLTRGVIDTTDHDSEGAQEVIPEGTYDPGEITGQMHYVAGSADDDAFLTAFTGAVLQDTKMVLKAGAGTEDLECAAYVTNYGPDEMPVNGKQTASFSLKVTGPSTQAAS